MDENSLDGRKYHKIFALMERFVHFSVGKPGIVFCFFYESSAIPKYVLTGEMNSALPAYCSCCGEVTRFSRQRVPHLRHACSTLLTAGLWSFVWLGSAISAGMRPWRCSVCGWHKPEFSRVENHSLERTPGELAAVIPTIALPAEQQNSSLRASRRAFIVKKGAPSDGCFSRRAEFHRLRWSEIPHGRTRF